MVPCVGRSAELLSSIGRAAVARTGAGDMREIADAVAKGATFAKATGVARGSSPQRCGHFQTGISILLCPTTRDSPNSFSSSMHSHAGSCLSAVISRDACDIGGLRRDADQTSKCRQQIRVQAGLRFVQDHQMRWTRREQGRRP